MSPNAQRIAIFATLGFTDEIEPGIGNGWYRRNPTTGETKRIPEYLTDLNAMYEAVAHLRRTDGFKSVKNRYRSYLTNLITIMCPTVPYRDWSWSQGVSCEQATAAQKAEAFVKACGLWDDSQ